MPRLRDLSGDDVIGVLRDFGFAVVERKGELVKLRKMTGRGEARTMTFPRVPVLDRLTLTAIYHEASQYVLEVRLRQRFYEG